jgi:CRISPR/Cas system-associated protein Csx1
MKFSQKKEKKNYSNIHYRKEKEKGGMFWTKNRGIFFPCVNLTNFAKFWKNSSKFQYHQKKCKKIH